MDFDFSVESITPTQTTYLTINATGALALPSGSTGQQPGSPVGGMLRYNTGNYLEFWNGSSWLTLTTSGGSVSAVTVTTGTGLSVSAGSTQTISTSGTFALTLSSELAGLSALSGNGILARTGAGTYTSRVITGTASDISVTNGDGVAGNPVIDLINAGTPVTASFVKITTDTKGRVTATTAVTTSDITALTDASYLKVSGSSLNSGANLTFSGGGTVTGLPTTPVGATDAASKSYVDSTAQGLTPKQAVLAATTVAGTLATSFANGSVIDGITLATGNRILIKNQASASDNGIYTVNATGAPTRSLDMNSWANVPSAYLFVETGTTLADTAWVCTSDPGGTLGTTAINWVQFGGAGTYTAGTGLTLTGTTFSLTSPVATTLGGTGTTTAPSAVGQILINQTGNTYVPATLTQGTGITIANASGSITITNAGVTSAVAGTAISVSSATGAVTITNTGVTSNVGGTGITVSGATGAVTITNAGVLSITGTANQITASASTGAVTLSFPSTLVAPGSVAITTALYQSIAATVSAAGTNQGTATAITTSMVAVTTVAAGTGVILPTAVSPFGWEITIANRGANSLLVYPGTGAQIDAAGANAGIVLPVGEEITIISVSATQWYAKESAVIVSGAGLSLTYGNGVDTFTNTGVTSNVAGSGISVSSATGAVTVTNTGVLSIAGTANQITASASTGAVTLSLPSTITIATSLTISGLTANSFLYSGTAGLLTSTTAPTNGQILIGSTGAAPVAAAITAGSGIAVTNGAGSISIASTIKLYVENSSSPTTPVATGTNSIALGSGSNASAQGSIAFGDGSSARTWGGNVDANGRFATAGDAQTGLYVLRNITSSATVTELFLDGVAATQRIVMPDNSVYAFMILIAARRTDATGGQAAYKYEGVMKRDTGAASVAIVGTASKTVMAESNTPWDANLTADTTNGSIKMSVTGEASKTIRWVATVFTTEITN